MMLHYQLSKGCKLEPMLNLVKLWDSSFNRKNSFELTFLKYICNIKNTVSSTNIYPFLIPRQQLYRKFVISILWKYIKSIVAISYKFGDLQWIFRRDCFHKRSNSATIFFLDVGSEKTRKWNCWKLREKYKHPTVKCRSLWAQI